AMLWASWRTCFLLCMRGFAGSSLSSSIRRWTIWRRISGRRWESADPLGSFIVLPSWVSGSTNVLTETYWSLTLVRAFDRGPRMARIGDALKPILAKMADRRQAGYRALGYEIDQGDH